MSEQVSVPSVYTLTTITGRRRNEDRETIVLTFETRRKPFLLTLLGLVPSSLIGLISAAFIGSYGLFVAAAALAGWAWLIIRRSRSGLRQATWRTLLDKRASRKMQGQFIQCGQQVLDGPPVQVQVLASMVYRDRLEDGGDSADLLGVGGGVGELRPLEPIVTGAPGRPGASTGSARHTASRDPVPATVYTD